MRSRPEASAAGPPPAHDVAARASGPRQFNRGVEARLPRPAGVRQCQRWLGSGCSGGCSTGRSSTLDATHDASSAVRLALSGCRLVLGIW